MAHGFGALRNFGLPRYAERFTADGMAVLLFDYRTFGDSDGQPRHLVSYRKQREDWKAAVQFAKKLEGVDASRIALWGTSYSGGHVIQTAATVPGISAVIAQVPAVDVWASARLFGFGFVFKATLHALWDIARSLLFLQPHYVPVFGPPDQFAALNQPGCDAGYSKMIPEDSTWQNRLAARELLCSLFNRPIRKARQVPCPALVIHAQQEQLLSDKSIRRCAELMPGATLVESPGDHFGVYDGEEFERLVKIQSAFLREHLNVAAEGASLASSTGQGTGSPPE